MKGTEKGVSRPANDEGLATKATNFWKAFNFKVALFLAVTPIIAIYGMFTTPVHPYTVVLTVVGYFLGMLGTTAGYHRLWAHRTYETVRAVQLVLVMLGTTAFSMSVKDWVKDHRAHHKYTDTDKDPYNAKKGFWWCHLGWLMWVRKMPKSDVEDIKADWLLRFQHKFFIPLAFVFGWVVPTVISGYFWNDWAGGFYYASVLKTVLLHHSIFSINSWAHTFGETHFTDQLTPRDSIFCAIITNGEGYHNFHHEFPNDYRNGIHWNAYDPSKWFIGGLELLNLTWGLKRTSYECIEKARIQLEAKKVELRRSVFFWGTDVSRLPNLTVEQVKKKIAAENVIWIIVNNIVHDVTKFADEHPGGRTILQGYNGKDATTAFTGGVYNHTFTAKHMLDTMRVGRLVRERA